MLVVGAGSVGTVLAGLLARAGCEAALLDRGGRRVEEVTLEDDEGEFRAAIRGRGAGAVAVLAVCAPDVEAAARAHAGRTLVTLQNGVESEAVAARFSPVIGAVWRLTCTLVAPGRARFAGRRRLVLGRHPRGVDAEVRALAAEFERAGFDVGLSERIEADKWLKLVTNLASAPNALVRREDHADPSFGELKARLMEEARDVLRAAGVEARSCDGRDPSVEEEIARQRALPSRARSVFNTTRRHLALGRRPPERYHDAIVALAARAGVPAPRNAAMLRLLEAATAPERYAAAELARAIG
jgi:2-dehydropantoate 2-reductase